MTVKPTGTELDPGAIGRAASDLGEPPIRFPATPDVTYLVGSREYVYDRDYFYDFAFHGKHNRLTIKRGFRCDLSSSRKYAVPRALIPAWLLDKSAGFHDLLYARQGKPESGEHQVLVGGKWRDAGHVWTRKEADRLLRVMLGVDPDGPGKVRRWMAYQGVRIGGRWAWRG